MATASYLELFASGQPSSVFSVGGKVVDIRLLLHTGSSRDARILVDLKKIFCTITKFHNASYNLRLE